MKLKMKTRFRLVARFARVLGCKPYHNIVHKVVNNKERCIEIVLMERLIDETENEA